jgi:hypothetical protein
MCEGVDGVNLIPWACDPREGTSRSGIVCCQKPVILAKIELCIPYQRPIRFLPETDHPRASRRIPRIAGSGNEIVMGYIVSRDCSISVTVSCENTVVWGKNTLYRFRTLFGRFKDLPLKYQKFYCSWFSAPPPPPHLDQCVHLVNVLQLVLSRSNPGFSQNMHSGLDQNNVNRSSLS